MGAAPKHEDFDLLLNSLLHRVKIIQEKLGEFLPIAAVISPEGKIVDVIGVPDKQPQPGAPKVLRFLEGALRGLARQNKCRAIGIAFDIRFSRSPDEPKSDAIQVFLEHRDGNVSNVILPYLKNASGQFTYGRLIAVRAEPKIFLQVDPAYGPTKFQE
jgi:hypothetical protein